MKLEYEDSSTHGRLVIYAGDIGLKGEGVLKGHAERLNTFVFNKTDEGAKKKC